MNDPSVAPPAAPAAAPVRAGEERVGDRVGKFVLERKLGEGGMGAVFVARDTITDARVALKILLPERRDTHRLDRFKRESLICQGLLHRNVVRIHDIGQEGDRYFLSMELLDGCDLREELDRAPRPAPERILEISRAVLAALSAAHEKGVVHRDLKPQNIFVTRDGTIKVLDFGCAMGEALPTFTTEACVVGTPSYMSPEQAEGAGRVDPRSDLYSFGVILYEMLTGDVPFAGDSPVGVAVAHVRETPAPIRTRNPVASEALSRVAERCLAKRREDRPQSADELLADLELAFAEDQGRDPSGRSEGVQAERSATPVARASEEPTVILGRRRDATRRGIFAGAAAGLVVVLAALLPRLNGPSTDQRMRPYLQIEAGDIDGAERTLAGFGTGRRAQALSAEGRAAVARARGNWESVRVQAAEALELEPELVYARVLEAERLAGEQRLAAARESYEAAVEARDGLAWQYVLAHTGLARLALDQEPPDLELARTALGKARGLAAEQVADLASAELHATGVMVGQAANDPESAREEARRWVRADPGNPVAAALLAGLELRQEQREDPERQERIAGLIAELEARVAADARGEPLEGAGVSGTVTILLEPSSSSAALPVGLEEALRFRLEQAVADLPDVRVVERELIEEVLAELRLGSGELADEGNRVKLGKLVAARTILGVKVNEVMGKTVMQVSVIDVQTSVREKSVSPVLDLDRFEAQIDEIAKDLAPVLGRQST